jgi:acyl-CoA thioesterase
MTAARDLVRAMQDEDPVAASLGFTTGDVSEGSVELRMSVGPTMVNSHGLVHGGYVFLLADTALAYCCVSLGKRSVTRTADIAFLAPGRTGDELVATATLRVDAGRATIVDVRVTAGDVLLAEFRGHGAALR